MGCVLDEVSEVGLHNSGLRNQVSDTGIRTVRHAQRRPSNTVRRDNNLNIGVQPTRVEDSGRVESVLEVAVYPGERLRQRMKNLATAVTAAKQRRLWKEHVDFLVGSSTDREIVEEVRRRVAGRKVASSRYGQSPGYSPGRRCG